MPDTGQARGDTMEMNVRKFDKLTEFDRSLFAYGPFYLGVSAGLTGLIANSHLRRALNISQGLISSSLPMAAISFLTSVALYSATISRPLLAGDLRCPTCVHIRGALVGAVGCGLYPVLLAVPLNAGLAARYNSTPMPAKGNALQFWKTLSIPIVKKMYPVLIIQGLFGTFLSSKHFDIYLKLLKLPENENLHD